MKLFLNTYPYKICYHIEGNLEDTHKNLIIKILSNSFQEFIPDEEFIKNHIEIGPRRNFKTSWNSNVCQIMKRCEIKNLESIEFTTFYPKNYQDYDKILMEEYKEIIPTNKSSCFSVDNIIQFNLEHSLGFDEQDIDYYEDIFSNLGRNPTNIELFDLAQCNSEHARHWFFNGKFILNEKEINELSLIELLKTTEDNNSNSLISFRDNSSVIKGTSEIRHKVLNNQVIKSQEIINFSYKAETHNFPTGISPFPGAATGSGGRMRDNVCVGIGGSLLAGTAGYCVGDIDKEYDNQINSPRKILIEASNGASDYGNKVGEPLIQGFTRSYREDFKEGRIEWLKPIMFSGGMGTIFNKNIVKKTGNLGDLIVRIGGPAYNIGMGGGTASSRSQDQHNIDDDLKAVQRGDPEMANKVFRFVEKCCSLDKNPIISIHDQGSGGMANVTREISEPMGAKIFLDKVDLGDSTMNSLEKWIAEYQEQITILIRPISLEIVENIAKIENVPIKVVGYINNETFLEVYSGEEQSSIVKLPIMDNKLVKKFYIEKPNTKYTYPESVVNDKSIIQKLEKVFKHISVCSKGYLVNKVDRSVGGLIVQQQCVGPFQLPLSNYSLVKNEFLSESGLVSAIGEKPINGLYNLESMVDMTVSEMLTNIIWGNIEDIEKINCVANWMWSSTEPEEAFRLRKALHLLVDRVNKIGFSINGGKDSLSMNVKVDGEQIKSPNTLVLSGYTNTTNYRKKITPHFKSTNSKLLLLKINNKKRLGGSILQEVLGLNSNLECPRIDCWKKFKNILESIQELISNEFILSGHDRSDGGLITTLIEMSISSGIGIHVNGDYESLFNEEMGLVIEISLANFSNVKKILRKRNVGYSVLGNTNNTNFVKVFNGDKLIFNEKINYLRYLWSERSLELEKEQNNLECIEQEKNVILHGKELKYKIQEEIFQNLRKIELGIKRDKNKKIAILRDEGSNGDREMRAAFFQVGFEVYDVSIQDLIYDNISLRDFIGIVFVGGFSYSDVLGAGEGWKTVIENNEKLKKEFDLFYKRYDTFSLGVCNGCQVMSKLGYLDENIKLETNKSGKFESRFNLVKIEKNNSVFLSNMEGMVMGVWSSHKEGQMVGDSNNTPIKYVDPMGKPTEIYPYNPNGSIGGICAFSSECGRHLAMMPHPERCFMTSQIPYLDKNHELYNYTYSPWILMFKNVFDWCSASTFV